jgi:hypothetical protein
MLSFLFGQTPQNPAHVRRERSRVGPFAKETTEKGTQQQ